MNRVIITTLALVCLSFWTPEAFAQQLFQDSRAAAFSFMAPQGSAPPISIDLPEPERERTERRRYERREPGFGYGLQATGGYAVDHELSLYGVSGVLRYSLLPYLSMELDFGLNGGGDDSLLVPISLSGLGFINLRGRLHPYIMVGVALTVIEDFGNEPTSFFGGAHIGLGLENMFTRNVGLTMDLRAFVLEHIADEEDQLEWGMTLNYGFVFYN